MAMEILIPSAAIRNLIREDKVHQIYGMMQTGQAKHGMQTFNQSLAALYFKRMITLETALARSSYPDELQEIINRGPASLNPALHRVGGGVPEMPSFVWKGKTRTGQVQEGQLLPTRATPPSAVLRRQQIQVTSIREKGRESSYPPPRRRRRRQAASPSSPASSRSCSTPACRWCSAWRSSATRRRTAPSRPIIQQVRTDVEAGASLADAMRKHPKAFDNLFTNMVAAGEAGGILDIILQRLSVYIEKAVKLNSPGQVGADLPGVDHRHRRPRGRSSSSGRSSRSSPSSSPAWAARCRCLTRIVIGASNFVADYSSSSWSVIVAGVIAIASCTRPRTAGGSSTARCSRSRSSACCCARSPWPASAARSAP